jgi:hypothetical protein
MELAHELGVNSPQVVAYVASLTPAPTETPLPTATELPTDTPVPPTETPSPVPPTDTPAPSATPSAVPTETAVPPTPTATAILATPTRVPTRPPTATPTPSVLFEDHFEKGVDKWTPYLHLGRLAPGQWYWDGRAGYQDSGGYAFHHSAHGTSKKDAEDAITMVLVPGSDAWTDYRAHVKFKVDSGKKVGLWFRGAFKESDNKGQWFTGYYCQALLRDDSDKDRVQLSQLRTYEEPGNPVPEKDEYYYHFTNPEELAKVPLAQDLKFGQWYEMVVEVRGPNIKCYVGDELAVDHTDGGGSVFLKGTIGIVLYGSDESEGVMSFDDVVVEPIR